jgi:hypothetical protein
MAAYRDLIDADGVYIHYELTGNYADSEGVATTTGTQFGGTTDPVDVASFVKNQASGNTAKDFSDRGIYLATAAQNQACFGTALDDNDALSIECWYKPTTLRATGVNNLIRHDGTLWWLRVTSKKAEILINTTTTTNTSVSGATTLVNGNIYHLVGTWDGDKLRVYVNGALDATSSAITGVLTTGTNANATYLGSPGTETMDGVIDEVAIYRKTLSATEILNHYNSGIGLVSIPAGTTTNITLDAKDATVTAGTNAIINAGTTTNIAVDAKDSNIIIDSIVSSTVTNISLLGYAPIVIASGSVIIPAVTPNITINNTTPTVSLGFVVSATKSNIQLTGGELYELYPTLVLSADPVHYYKFGFNGDTTLIEDIGSDPIDGYWELGEFADYDTGIPGDPLSNSTNFNSYPDDPENSDIITFDDKIFINQDNLTYEFWIKTLSDYVPIFCVDNNNKIISGNTYRNNAVIGIRDGELALWIHQQAGVANVIKSGNKINNNIWNHIVLTKKTTDKITEYESYVNGIKTNSIISLAEFFPYAENSPRQTLMNYLNDNSIIESSHEYSANIDELAIYYKVLTNNEILEHYNTGHGIAINSIIAAGTATDIDVDAKDATFEFNIIVSSSNIKITDKGVIGKFEVATGGPTDKVIIVGSSVTSTLINGKTATNSASATIAVETQNTNISIKNSNTQIKTREVNFKFISASDTSLSANDAESLTNLDYGGLLYNQIKKLLFRIGNTEEVPSTFVISTISNEDLVPNAVKLSIDNITYSDTLTIENVSPNYITDIIYTKFDVNALDVLGPGTFLIHVEQYV